MSVKNYSASYLYNKSSNYEKNIYSFLVNGERIDKTDSSFDDIKYQIKNRQKTSVLFDVLNSPNIVLMYSPTPMPRAFKVFFGKDTRDDKQKVFIDCSECLYKKDGTWRSTNIDILVAYLISAMNNNIFYNMPSKYQMNTNLVSESMAAFSKLFTNIIDYLYKINTMESTRDYCIYLSSMYFLVGIMEKDPNSESVKSLAIRNAKISERQAQVLDIYVTEHSYDNIKEFIDLISKALKIPKLTLETFIEKWIYLYGAGTMFATELFIPFANMLTDAYSGAYLNNQKTIEKVVANEMISFTLDCFKVGQSVINNK